MELCNSGPQTSCSARLLFPAQPTHASASACPHGRPAQLRPSNIARDNDSVVVHLRSCVPLPTRDIVKPHHADATHTCTSGLPLTPTPSAPPLPSPRLLSRAMSVLPLHGNPFPHPHARTCPRTCRIEEAD